MLSPSINDINVRAVRAVEGKIRVEGKAAQLVDDYKTSMGNKKRRGTKEAVILKELSAILTTPEDQEILKVGCSNQSYHYWGSSKFYAQAGKAFAEALAGFHEK